MVTLATARLHLRVDGSEEDGLIEGMIAAASDHLASIGVDMTADPLPAAVDHAVLIAVGHLYRCRGDDDAPAMPAAVDRLAAPYREVSL